MLIKFDPTKKNQDRIDYLSKLLDVDEKRLELIDQHRNKNLAHALVIFPTAYGAVLKFLHEANPYLISLSLLSLALVFFSEI